MTRRLIPIVCLAVLSATACSALSVAAATVNGEKIPESEIESELGVVGNDPTFGDLLQRANQRGEDRRAILTGLIRQAVIAQEAGKRGVRVTQEQTERLLSQEAQNRGMSVEEFLRSENLTREQGLRIAERIVLTFELRDKVVEGIEIERADLLEYYESHEDVFAEVHLRRITVRDEEDARSVLEELDGGRDFATVAQERSIDDLADEGGEMSFVATTRLSPEAQDTISRVEDVGVADPVPTAAGFEIYRVLERRTRPFEEVQNDIQSLLTQQGSEERFGEWLSERLRAAKVVVNPKFGQFDRAELTVVPAPRELDP